MRAVASFRRARSRPRPFGGAVTGAAAVALVACAGGEIDVSAPRDEISASPSSLFESEPTIAVTSSGVLVAAWMAVSGKQSVAWSRSDDGGATWSTPRVVATPGGHQARDPVLAAGTGTAGGDVWLAWTGFDLVGDGSVANTAIFAARLLGGDTGIVRVSEDDGALVDKPRLVFVRDPSAPLVTYTRATSDGASSIIAARSDDGVTWSRSSASTADPVASDLAFGCAAASGPVYVAFWRADGVRLRRSDDRGATWTLGTIVSAPGESPAFTVPSCATDGDRVWVSYGLSDAPGPDSQTIPLLRTIVVAMSRDGGATIAQRAEPFDVPTLNPNSHVHAFANPGLALGPAGLALAYYAGAADGDAHAGFRVAWWNQECDKFGQNLERYAVGNPVGPAITLTGRRDIPAWLGDYEGVAVTSGGLVGVFVVNATGDAHVAFGRVGVPPFITPPKASPCGAP